MTETAIRDALYERDIGEAKNMIDVLLKGCIPNNFSFQDILTLLLPFTEDNFIVLPIWTLNLSNLEASATCMVQHWPIFTDEQLQDSAFLSSIRVLLPLFKVGSPIGHARFMFFDNWEPLPTSTLRDEDAQWKATIREFVPLQELTDIIFDYDVLERYDPPCNNPHSCKIIDSIPGSMRAFQQDVNAFSRIMDLLKDPNWCPDSWERKTDLKRKLICVRAFLNHVTVCPGETAETTSPTMGAVLLPSTTQIGLECIIITLCRVISIWITPYEVPLEDCRSLCEDKKGRRAISELLLRVKLQDLPSKDEVPVVEQSPGVALVEGERTESDKDEVPVVEQSPGVAVVDWYNVYDRPTLSVHSSNADYEPRELWFRKVLGYTVYLDCKWVHKPRNQNFLPNQTVLAIGGITGCLFICPVYAHISSQWHFLVLGTPGYTLFRAAGKTTTDTKTGRSKNNHFQAAPLNHGWTPPPTSQEQLDAFIADWKDPTFKQHHVHLDDTSGSPQPLVLELSDTSVKTSTGGLRRSRRSRKPRQVMHPVTPVRPKQVHSIIQMPYVYVRIIHCVL